MNLYRFSPIKNHAKLLKAIEHTHFECFKLCKQALGLYLPVAENMVIFCHYDDEYTFLTQLRKDLTETSRNINQKYFLLHQPIVIPSQGDVPETTYTHLYIRKPDPYRAHVGDVDFVMGDDEYLALKKSLGEGTIIKGARVFERADMNMVELYDPDSDALGYVSPKEETEIKRPP